VVTEPTMDLPISNPVRPNCFAWHYSNKAVSLSFDWCCSGSLMGRFQVCRGDCLSVRLSPWWVSFW